MKVFRAISDFQFRGVIPVFQNILLRQLGMLRDKIFPLVRLGSLPPLRDQSQERDRDRFMIDLRLARLAR